MGGLYEAVVAGAERVSERHTVLRLRLGADMAAEPGQFVMLRPEGAPEERLLMRPFGIAGLEPSGAEAVLSILIAPVGPVSRSAAAMRPGQRARVLGPLGRGFPLDRLGDQPVLLGGGYGIAPLCFLAQRLSGPGRAGVHLIYGVRTRSEFIELDRAFPHLDAGVVVASEDGSIGRRGTVLDAFGALLERVTPSAVAACGPLGMLEAASQACAVRSLPCYVLLEAFMGCGRGLCGSCAVPARAANGRGRRFIRLCMEGPVVEASEVDWDSPNIAGGPARVEQQAALGESDDGA